MLVKLYVFVGIRNFILKMRSRLSKFSQLLNCSNYVSMQFESLPSTIDTPDHPLNSRTPQKNYRSCRRNKIAHLFNGFMRQKVQIAYSKEWSQWSGDVQSKSAVGSDLSVAILRCLTVTTGIMTSSQGKKGTKTGKFHWIGVLIAWFHFNLREFTMKWRRKFQ